MSLVDPRSPSPAPRDVLVETHESATFGEVRAGLAALVVDGCADFALGGRSLRDDDAVGSGGLVRGALLTVGSGPASPGRMPLGSGALLELAVVGGPGAGRVVSVGRGEHVIGRGPGSAVRLEDPGVSRSHSVVTVSDAGVHVRDLDPTNPSTIDREPVSPAGSELAPGACLRLASTTLVLRRTSSTPAALATEAGVVRVNRRPRFVVPAVPVEVTFPPRPERPTGVRAPVIAALAPLVLSIVLTWVLKSPAMLLFALMSPVMVVAQWWSDRRHGRTSYRKQLADHDRAIRAATARLASALESETTTRHAEAPDLAATASVAELRDARLWERRPSDPDHLLLRIGTADQPSRTVVVGREAQDADNAHPDNVVDVLAAGAGAGGGAAAAEPRRVRAVPALVDLARDGVLGVAGPRGRVLAVAGSLLVQLTTWHSPRTTRLVVLTTSETAASDWMWASRLPHAHAEGQGPLATVASTAEDSSVSARVAELESLVALRAEHRRASAAGPALVVPVVVVVLDGSHALRRVPGVADLLSDGPSVGLRFVCLDDAAELLPAETTVQVVVNTDPAARAVLRSEGDVVRQITPDLPSQAWVERVSRALAPLEDATPDLADSGLPDRVGFVELHRQLGTDPTTPESITTVWSRSEGEPVAAIGIGRTGVHQLDLAQDGPHTLLGGTTGSGKSELLQTLVAGLAVSNRPDELGFVLVDYKGGSAFKECARLPHTLGVVTDLDEGLTARALTSLGAEVKRREAMLARAGAKDLDDYRRQRARDSSLPRVARLVIVVDEFKMLADELPGFVDGLVRIAAVGRSLGIHLVLATQRPGGIVTGDMRSNIALRIALRVRDRSDSEDVLESPAAADVSDRTPGRAWLRAAGGRLEEVQTAYAGAPLRQGRPDGPDRDDEPETRVLPLEWRQVATGAGLGPDGSAQAADDAAPTQLTAVVDAVAEAARSLHIPAQASPWLPPLPERLSVEALTARASRSDARGAGVPLGLADVPAEQAQVPATWDLHADGNLGIAGGARTGRTTVLRTIALGLAERHTPTELHLHVLEGTPGSLADLAALPHVGSVTGTDDPRLAARVVRRVADSLTTAPTGDGPLTVLIVDGWESLESAFDAVDHGLPSESLLRIARDGLSSGVRLLVAGGRGILSGRLAGHLQRRLVLPMPDPLDLTLAGISAAEAEAHRHVGRAIELPDGNRIQLAHVGDAPDLASQVRAAELVSGIAGMRHDANSPGLPWRVQPLPRFVLRSELAAATTPPPVEDPARSGAGTALRAALTPPPTQLVAIGRGGDDATVVGFDLARDERRALVVGPPRSGRSTALAVLALELAGQGRAVAVITPRRSAMSQLSGIRHIHLLSPADDDQLATLRATHPSLALLVDDAEALDDTPVEHQVLAAAAALDTVAGADGFVAAAVETRRAQALYRGIVPELARHGTGVVLMPGSPAEGELLGQRLEVARERFAGRGSLVRDGVAVPVQVAMADADQPDTRCSSDGHPSIA